jgi:hypothetical protein
MIALESIGGSSVRAEGGFWPQGPVAEYAGRTELWPFDGKGGWCFLNHAS